MPSIRVDKVLRADGDGKLPVDRLPATIPKAQVEGFEALENRIGSFGLSATELGVDPSAADNTAAFETICNAYQNQYFRRYIHLPQGIVRGHLPMAPGIVWVMNGTVLRFPTTGPTKHMVYPLDPSWWGETDGTGPHRSGIIGHGTIDGEAYSWGIWPMAQPAVPSVTSTGVGSLPTGSYQYRIAYKTPFGLTRPSDPASITTTSTGRVTVSWSNPAAASSMEVVIFGRGTTVHTQRVAVTLPAGSNTWIDDGTTTPEGATAQPLDTSAPSVLIAGALTEVQGIEIKAIPGLGLATRCEYDYPAGEWEEETCGVIRDVKITKSGGEGYAFCGPRDHHVDNLTVQFSGQHSNSDGKSEKTHVLAIDYGPLNLRNSKGSNNCLWGVEAYTKVDIADCDFGGGSQGQVGLFADSSITNVHVDDPRSATACGVRVGESWYNAYVLGTGIQARGFSSSSGPAIDLREAAPDSSLRGSIEQTSGTRVAGSTICYNDFTIHGNDGGYISTPAALVHENTPSVVGKGSYTPYSAATLGDTPALQAALTAANAGGEVYVQPGTYTLNTELVIPAGVTLRCAGKGVVFKATTALNSSAMVQLSLDSELIGGLWDGDKDQSVTSNGIALLGSRATVKGVRVKDVNGTAIYGWSAGSIKDIVIADAHVSGTSQVGIALNSMVGDSTVRDCTVQDASKGIVVAGDECALLDSLVRSTSGNAVDIEGDDVVVDSCRSLYSGGEGFLITGSVVTINACHAKESTYRGIRLVGGARQNVTSCIVTNSAAENFRADSTASRYSFVGCFSTDTRQSKQVSTGIAAYGSIGLIANCNARNADHQGDGIYVDSAVSASVTLEGNKTT